MKSPRETLKEKLLKTGPCGMIEVTEAELQYTRTPEFISLIKEIVKEANKSEDGLAAMAGEPSTKEPNHKEHLDRQYRREVTFEEAVKPLMVWLADNHHPHVHAIVSATTAELVEGLESFNSFEFVKD